MIFLFILWQSLSSKHSEKTNDDEEEVQDDGKKDGHTDGEKAKGGVVRETSFVKREVSFDESTLMKSGGGLRGTYGEWIGEWVSGLVDEWVT